MIVASGIPTTGPKLLLHEFKMGLSFNAFDHLKEEPMFHYVAKIASFGDHYEDSTSRMDARQIAENAVRKTKITTKRFNPQACAVEISELKIKLGNVEKTQIAVVNVMPPFAPMTENEYQDEMAKVVKKIPDAFHAFVMNQSWDQGHSAGYEEVVNIADGLANSLVPAIKAFQESLKDLEKKQVASSY